MSQTNLYYKRYMAKTPPSVTDAPIMDRFRPGWVYDTTDLDPEKGETIEDLAKKLGLVPQELKKTVDEYNAS